MAVAAHVADPADDADRARVRHLVSVSEGDPLAPFALRPEKSYVFSPDGEAAVGFRVRLGLAVASGDPVGRAQGWPAAIDAFVMAMQARGLRIAVIGSGERAREIWARYRLSWVAIGRDVVVRGGHFEMTGRLYHEGEADVNDWTVTGEPELHLSNPAVPTGMTTVTQLVNRIPDVINAPPGFITVEKLPRLRYRAFPLGVYLDDRRPGAGGRRHRRC